MVIWKQQVQLMMDTQSVGSNIVQIIWVEGTFAVGKAGGVTQYEKQNRLYVALINKKLIIYK